MNTDGGYEVDGEDVEAINELINKSGGVFIDCGPIWKSGPWWRAVRL